MTLSLKLVFIFKALNSHYILATYVFFHLLNTPSSFLPPETLFFVECALTTTSFWSWLLPNLSISALGLSPCSFNRTPVILRLRTFSFPYSTFCSLGPSCFCYLRVCVSVCAWLVSFLFVSHSQV